MLRPRRAVVRRDAGIYALERTLRRRGFPCVAGSDEAGRGACAGPLVVAAAVLRPGARGEIPELADSKLLTPAARDRVYDEVLARAAAYSVVVIPSTEVDTRGLHRSNVEGMRRAFGRLPVRPDYVLTDGFRVDGIGVPSLAVIKGDRVAACIAAASVLAKVTRDRIMTALHEDFPHYDFAQHKGYVTPVHAAALGRHGPCPEHRMSYVNVAAALAAMGEWPDEAGEDAREEAADVFAEVQEASALAGAATPGRGVVRHNGAVRDGTSAAGVEDSRVWSPRLRVGERSGAGA